MLRYILALLSIAIAAPATAEVGQAVCDAARALQVTYLLKIYPQPMTIFVPQVNWPAKRSF